MMRPGDTRAEEQGLVEALHEEEDADVENAQGTSTAGDEDDPAEEEGDFLKPVMCMRRVQCAWCTCVHMCNLPCLWARWIALPCPMPHTGCVCERRTSTSRAGGARLPQPERESCRGSRVAIRPTAQHEGEGTLLESKGGRRSANSGSRGCWNFEASPYCWRATGKQRRAIKAGAAAARTVRGTGGGSSHHVERCGCPGIALAQESRI